MVSTLASCPSIHGIEKIIILAEVIQWCCLEESGQWLENVDRTHLVLASNNLVRQKRLISSIGTHNTLTELEFNTLWLFATYG